MRLTIVLAAGLGCTLLAGCDEAPPAPAAPPVQQTCNCQPANPAPTPPAETPVTTHRTHYHHAWHAQSYSETEITESETSTYGYVSDSRTVATDSTGSYSRSRYTGGQLWIDGFGRAYHADHPARVAGTMTRDRLKPWGHYDEDCDER